MSKKVVLAAVMEKCINRGRLGRLTSHSGRQKAAKERKDAETTVKQKNPNGSSIHL